ncbi:unnamed protein product [Peronospora belbahrii]|uniref:Uncharacterized protein n=1 Tax=Peronospora belbahrii TaxID=622444 RepID=A0ABN8CY40_9STRA|nr:unnamed protein product [Peronospora belbahrii]
MVERTQACDLSKMLTDQHEVSEVLKDLTLMLVIMTHRDFYVCLLNNAEIVVLAQRATDRAHLVDSKRDYPSLLKPA